MLDSPKVLLGISAASAIATFSMGRRCQPSAPATLARLSDQELLAVLASLQVTNDPACVDLRPSRAHRHSISVMRSASEMREADHPEFAGWAREQDAVILRRLTLLIVEEIERRRAQQRGYDDPLDNSHDRKH